jgi:hypothetical protein
LQFSTLLFNRTRLLAGVVAFATIFAATVALAQPAHAAALSATWNGGVGNWNVGANWSGGVVPCNTASNTYSVDIDGGNTGVISSVTLDINCTIDNLTVDAGDSLVIPNIRSLTVIGDSTSGAGSVSNSGVISLNSVGNNTDLRVNGGNVTLSGSGTVSLSDNGANRILGTFSTDRLINQGNTISGAGQIGANTMALTNQATITANGANLLIIDPNGTGAINTGTMNAAAGTLHLSTATYTNTGGLIEALNASTVRLAGANIVGGTLSTSGSGIVRNVSTSTLNGVTNAGSISQTNNTTLNLVGSLNNTGDYAMVSAGNNTDLVMNGDVSLTGGGTFTLSNNAANRFRGSVGSNRLTNVDNTISGSGQIGANAMAFTNLGLVVGNGSVGLTIDPSATGAINSSSMRASGGGFLMLQGGSFDNAGGTIEALTGSSVRINSSTVTGGILTTSGSGEVRNAGSVTLNGLTNSGVYTQPNNQSTTLIGTINNTGSILLNSAGNSTDLIVSGGDVTLTGGGVVTFSNNVANRIRALVGTDSLINQDNTISGAGNIGVNTMGFVNRGAVDANVSNTLTIDPSATGVINSGTVKSSTGGTLVLLSGNFQNFEGVTNGVVRADGGVLIVQSATITGGIVDVVGTGEVQLTTGTISDGALTNSSTGTIRTTGGTSTVSGTIVSNPLNGQITIGNNTTLRFSGSGTYVNAGDISLVSLGNNTDFIMTGGNVVLTGGGTVSLSNNFANRIYGATGADRLTNQDNTISGSGQIGINQMALTNSGTIVANQSASLTVDLSATGGINTGTMRASGTGTLRIQNSVFTNTGGTLEGVTGAEVELPARP